MPASLNMLDLLLVAVVTIGFGFIIARTRRTTPPPHHVTEQSIEGMTEVERLRKRVAELEAKVARIPELESEVRRMQIAFDAVMADSAEVRERNARLEELIARKDDQIKQLWLDVEDWRRKSRGG